MLRSIVRSTALVLLVFVSTACGLSVAVAPATSQDHSTTSTAFVTTTTTALSTSATAEPTTTVEPTTTTTVLSTETLRPGESLAARSDGEVHVYAEAGDDEPALVLDAQTMLGTPRVMQVLEGPTNGWMRVALPVRPNGSEGWVREEGLILFTHAVRVEVDISDRHLAVIGPDGPIIETTVAVGSSASPTPTGTFFVTDSVDVGDPSSPWGPWAFGTSAYSDVVTEFNGGEGIIGIHGTNRPDSIGYAQSLGCVRVPNDVALELSGLISAGVPVEIVP